LALKNLSNEAVKMITERGTSECLIILGVMKQILAQKNTAVAFFASFFWLQKKMKGC